ncbi:hypothetical protein VTO73DRAFT_2384 [Trametes versicolor]
MHVHAPQGHISFMRRRRRKHRIYAAMVVPATASLPHLPLARFFYPALALEYNYDEEQRALFTVAISTHVVDIDIKNDDFSSTQSQLGAFWRAPSPRPPTNAQITPVRETCRTVFGTYANHGKAELSSDHSSDVTPFDPLQHMADARIFTSESVRKMRAYSSRIFFESKNMPHAIACQFIGAGGSGEAKP